MLVPAMGGQQIPISQLANIKLASVATDALGASGRAMLDAIIQGESDSNQLAEMKVCCGIRRRNCDWLWKAG